MSCDIFNNSDAWRDLGDYGLEMVEITTNNDQVGDIKKLVTNLNIFEDMFGVFMSGNLTFNDSGGFTEKLPIIGSERVTIKLKTPGTETTRKYEFYVYNISNKSKTGTDSSYVVSLEFCSLEMIANSMSRVSKSVSGTQDLLASQVFEEQFGTLGKKFVAEIAQTEVKMNIPSWTPVDTICWLTSNAVSRSNQTPSYVFFENVSGFNFITIESLKSKPVSFDFFSDPSRKDKLDPQNEVRRVIQLNQNRSPNALTMMGGGLYGSKTIYHDPITKSVVTGKYENDIKPSLGSSSNTLPKQLQTLAKNSEQYTTYKCVNPNLFNEGERSTSETTFDVEGRRKSYLGNMLYNRMTITVSGNTILDVGDTVNLNVKSQVEDNNDKSVSGKYIISAICHNISSKGHFSVFELITDGFGEISKGVSK